MRTTGGPGAKRGAPARGGASTRAGAARREPGVARSGTSARGGTSGRGGTAARAEAPRPTPRSAPRPASRPAAGRRGSPAGAAKRTRAPQPRRLTGRAAVLGLLLLGLLLAYAYPVRVYLSQQAEISLLMEHQSAQRKHIDALAEERQMWNDDEYVKAQAMRRLHYVLPGKVPYVVIGGNDAPQPPGGGGAKTAPAAQPWYGKLWSSLQAADRPPAPAK